MKMRPFSDEERLKLPPQRRNDMNAIFQRKKYSKLIMRGTFMRVMYFSDEEIPNQGDYERFIHEDYFSGKDRPNHPSINGGTT